MVSVAALNSRAIESEVCKVVAFPLQSTSILIHYFSGSHVEIIFRLFLLRTKEMKILELKNINKKSVLLCVFKCKQV